MQFLTSAPYFRRGEGQLTHWPGLHEPLTCSTCFTICVCNSQPTRRRRHFWTVRPQRCMCKSVFDCAGSK